MFAQGRHLVCESEPISRLLHLLRLKPSCERGKMLRHLVILQAQGGSKYTVKVQSH